MGVTSGPKIHNVHSKPDRYTQLLVRGGGADESQTFTDSSVYGRTITASGNVKYESSDAAGVHFYNSSIEFDGTGDYLTTSAFNFLQNKWTVECWFYYDTSFPGTIEGLIALDYDGSSGSTNNAMNFGVTNGAMALLVSSSVASGWNVVNTTGGTVSASTWHHGAAVFDGSTYKVYLDGVEVISVSSSTATTSSDNSQIIIGTTADSSSSQSWDGYIDEIRVSSIARYTKDFTHFNKPSGPFNVDRLVLCLDANNAKSYAGSGTVWRDLSPKGNHGTLVHAPAFVTDPVIGASYFDFDGTSDYATISNTATSGLRIANPGSVTTGIWVRVDDAADTNGLMGPWSSTGQAGWGIVGNYSGGIRPIVDDGADASGYWLAVGSPAAYIPADGKFHYVVVVWRRPGSGASAVVSYYLDGVFYSVTTFANENGATAWGNHGQDFAIAKLSTNMLDGQVAAVHMYNRELTAKEIKQNFNSHRSRFGL